MKLTRILFSLVGAAVLTLLLASCETAPEPRAFAIQVTLDSTLVGTSVQIDFIGANQATDLPKWQSYNLTEYWQPNNAFRRDAAKYTMQFDRDKPNRQMLLANDAHWAEWLRTGAQNLVIVADLPGITGEGNSDGRRLILPLDKNAWDSKTQTIEVLVQESGLKLMTPRKP